MTAFQRAVVTAEAATWLRTPYHLMGRVKGGGTDCLMLLAGLYEAAGVIPHIEVAGLASTSQRGALSRWFDAIRPRGKRGRLYPAMPCCSSLVDASHMAQSSSDGLG